MILSFNAQATDVFTFDFESYEAWVDHNKQVEYDERRYDKNKNVDLRRHDLNFWHRENHEDHATYEPKYGQLREVK